MRAGILSNDDIPRHISRLLGNTHKERINTLVQDMIFHTLETGTLSMQPQVERAMLDLREFMFERVYRNPVAKGEESKARDIVKRLYEYYVARTPIGSPLIFRWRCRPSASSVSSATILPA